MTASCRPGRIYDRWLGPFKRPRNAMVELEREVTVLRNRHGADVQVGDEIDVGTPTLRDGLSALAPLGGRAG